MAEDLLAASGSGLVHHSGVVLAPITGLCQGVNECHERSEQLETRNCALLDRLQRIEQRLDEDFN